jgi:hypothetical protein
MPDTESGAAVKAPAKAMAVANSATGTGLQQRLTTDLQHSGFTDVTVLPDSFLVQAKDKTGNPVTIVINPGSVTEFMTADSSGQDASTGIGGIFTNVSARDDLSSKVIGLDVYNNANQDIGTIKDIAFNAAGVRAYIIGVGGFLGIDERYVAVRPSAIQLTYSASEKKWHAAIDTNAAQLKSAPAYKDVSN